MPSLQSPHLRDHLFFTVGRLLFRQGGERMRECPVCGRFFYAFHARQKFDRVQCKNRAAWVDFTARQKDEIALRDRKDQTAKKTKHKGKEK